MTTLENKGVLVAEGQGKLKGKIFRIAHMNIVTEKEIILTLSLIELTLKQLSFPIELGKGVAAAEEVFSQ